MSIRQNTLPPPQDSGLAPCLVGMAEDYLHPHSGKKFAVRPMGRELNPIYVIFRAGWEVRNSHTLFDYLVNKDVAQDHDIRNPQEG